MSHAQKVKLMDSGTVLFPESSLQEACSRVQALLSGGTCTETAPGHFTADFSNLFFYSIVEAVVEETSTGGLYAASFREGNRCRCILYPFPSRKALRRMRRIKADLGAE